MSMASSAKMSVARASAMASASVASASAIARSVAGSERANKMRGVCVSLVSLVPPPLFFCKTIALTQFYLALNPQDIIIWGTTNLLPFLKVLSCSLPVVALAALAPLIQMLQRDKRWVVGLEGVRSLPLLSSR